MGPSCGTHASYTFYKAIKFSLPPKKESGTGKKGQKQNSVNKNSVNSSAENNENEDHSKSRQKILALGEFFFVKIWADSEFVSIGELQLLWEDKNTNQVLASLRLYFLPEYTPEGRTIAHGEVGHMKK